MMSATPRPRAFLRAARGVLVLAVAAAVALLVGACGSTAGAGGDGRPTIVVTTSPLGALVSQLVGDRARVDVVIPNQMDPHDFQPSVRDVEKFSRADLVVANGAGLEGTLERAIDQARSDGVPVFVVADNVAMLAAPDGHGHEAAAVHDHGAVDPHVWLDPVRMARAVTALGPEVEKATGLDLGDRTGSTVTELRALSAELAAQADTISPARRVLVTGHDSLGYFAARYRFTVVGAVIPSLSSQAEASSRQVTELVATIRARKVPAVFSEVGTPKAVVDAIAKDSGARVVDLNTHAVDNGSYADTMRHLMTTVVDGLKGAGS